MPIYEYRCGVCGHLHDELQKVSDEPLTQCPECAKPALKRLISAPSFRLKGSGWYETDFKSDKERKRNLVEGGGDNDKKASGDSSKESSKDGAKSDTSKGSGSSAGASESKPSSPKPAGTGSEAA